MTREQAATRRLRRAQIADLRSQAALLTRLLDRAGDGITAQSFRARLAEVERQIAELAGEGESP